MRNTIVAVAVEVFMSIGTLGKVGSVFLNKRRLKILLVMNLIRFFNFIGMTFVIAFVIMLIAVALILCNEDIANKFADVGYYFLLAAVVANIVVVAKEFRTEKS